MKRLLAAALLAALPLAFAQPLKLDVFEKLKKRATSVVDLNLNKDLLSLGMSFLGGDRSVDAAKIKKLAEGLNGIQIRSLEFEKEGDFSSKDVQELIEEMAGKGWQLVISADEKKEAEISRIWVMSGSNGEVGGMRILSAEPKELTVIEINGKVRLEDLKDLSGLGIPSNITNEHSHSGKKNED